MSTILYGNEVVASINEEVKKRILKLKDKGVNPTLGIIRVGENSSDLSYERGASKRAETVGITVRKYNYDVSVTTETLVEEIKKINKDDTVHGVLIFRPLPKHIDDNIIRNTLLPSKDIDGITDISMSGIYSGTGIGFPPCTAMASMEMLKHYGCEIAGKNAVVLGRSLVIGKPVAIMLMAENATVTICHSKTKNIAEIAKSADILVAAMGRGKSINCEYTNENQTIVDVGINFDENGKMCGDVDFDDVFGKVKAITPVPKGVGTVTTSMLMKNVLVAAEKAIN